MKKCFALFLVLTISLFTLGGCASRDDAAANGPPEPSTSVTDPAENNEPNEEAQNQPDENGPATETPSQSGEGPEEPEEIAGIIAMTSDFTSRFSFTVVSINSETGEQQEISSFSIPSVTDDSQYMTPNDYAYYYASARQWLSADFDKVAATRVALDTGERRAGWFTTNGEFFDVTETLGLSAQSDFDTPVRHYAVGFADGYFVYTAESDSGDAVYYSVPVENITPEAVQKMNALENVAPDMEAVFNYDYALSDWVDDTHCLVDNRHDSEWNRKTENLLFDVTTGEATSYVPGDARYSWSGVVSPDGANVAFLSSPKGGTELPSLYVMPLAGGDPVKVEAELGFTKRGGVPGCVQFPTVGEVCTTLLDWR